MKLTQGFDVAGKQWLMTLAVGIFLGSTIGSRADEVWANTNNSGDWNVAGNWSGAAVPTATDNVSIIGTASSPDVFTNGGGGAGTTFHALSITVDGYLLNPTNGSHFVVGNTVQIGGARQSFLTIDGTSSLTASGLTLAGGAGTFNDLILSGSLNVGAGSINVGTNLVDSADILNLQNGSMITAGAINLDRTGIIALNSFSGYNLSTTLTGTFTSQIDDDNTGLVTISSSASGFLGYVDMESALGTVDVTSASFLQNSSGVTFHQAATFEVGVSATTGTNFGINVSNSRGSIMIDNGVTFTDNGPMYGSQAGNVLTFVGPGTMIVTGDQSTFMAGIQVNSGILKIQNLLNTSGLNIQGGEFDVDTMGQVTGNTVVQSGGVLRVDGSLIAATVSVLNGNVTGTGTISNALGSTLTIGDGMGVGGFLGAGNPVAINAPSVAMSDIGTLTVGNLVLNSDATTIVKVAGTTHNAAPTAGVDYDQFKVTGTAQLGGTLIVQAGAGVILPGDSFKFISSTGGIDPAHATFNTVDVLNNALGFTQTIQNAGDDYELIFSASQNSFTGFAGTPNQKVIATALDNVFATSGATPLIVALDGISGDALPGAFNQLSPQTLQVFGHTAFDGATFNSQQLNNHLANLRDGLTGFDGSQLTYMDSTLAAPLAQIKGRLLAWDPSSTPGLISDTVDPILTGMDMKDLKASSATVCTDPWSTFIAGNVILADLKHTDDVAHQNYTTGDVTAGADYRLNEHFTVGAQFAYGHTDADLDHSGSRATVDTYSPGVYASYVDGGWYGNGSFNYGYDSDTEDRNIQIGALTGTNHGALQGNQYTGNLTGGYEFHQSGWKFGPVASAQYANLGLNSFTESGPAALSVSSQSAESFRSQLGIEARYATKVGSAVLTPHGSVSWQHEFLDDSRGITSQFNGSGAGSFTVATSEPERDSAFINVGIDADITHSLTLFTDYSTQAGQDHFFAQSVQAGLKIGF